MSKVRFCSCFGRSGFPQKEAEQESAADSDPRLNLDLSQLLIGRRFANGSNSRVYHGLYEDNPVAVKIINIADGYDVQNDSSVASQLEKQFNREAYHLSRLNHPNVIKLVAAGRQPEAYCILTEYLSGGSLKEYLRLGREPLLLQEITGFALDIARGMEYIHLQGVVHRDLKPENILMNESHCLKIADFGIACREAECKSDGLGTYRWLAPEITNKKCYGRKVDVYSFALILWAMVTGKTPFMGMDPLPAALEVANKNLRPEIAADCPPAMASLIVKCWSSEPEKRPEFSQIVDILEQFQDSIARDGTLNDVRNRAWQDNILRILNPVSEFCLHDLALKNCFGNISRHLGDETCNNFNKNITNYKSILISMEKPIHYISSRKQERTWKVG